MREERNLDDWAFDILEVLRKICLQLVRIADELRSSNDIMAGVSEDGLSA